MAGNVTYGSHLRVLKACHPHCKLRWNWEQKNHDRETSKRANESPLLVYPLFYLAALRTSIQERSIGILLRQ
jgi:hypothetical protein